MDTVTVLLFIFSLLVAAWLGYSVGKAAMRRRFQVNVEGIRADAVKRSRAVLSGQFSEQLAPFLPGFPWKPTEARFIGKPVDFIIFKGMDEQEISEILFVEVKSGSSQLSQQERKLREAIDAKRVFWREYRVPEGMAGQRQQLKR
jgi:predicted Holliday junction resolvase-like endonuclease